VESSIKFDANGHHTGPAADESKPTGRTASVKGASIIRLEGEKIRSDYAYFDRKTIEEQLAPK
jgi:predicted ester cyclase